MELKYTVRTSESIYLGLQVILSTLFYGGVLFALTASQALDVGLRVGLILLMMHWSSAVFLAGYIRGNAVKASPTQFKEVFDIVNEQARALHLSAVPEVYVLQEGGFINAFASRLVSDYVVLFAPVVAEAYRDGEDTMRFIIGHELGHIKRNHLGFLKTIFTLPTSLFSAPLYLAYSRAREYTCDRIGYALSPSGALKGMGLLAVGPKLYKQLDIQAWISDTDEETGLATGISEFFATHPHLHSRIKAIQRLEKESV